LFSYISGCGHTGLKFLSNDARWQNVLATAATILLVRVTKTLTGWEVNTVENRKINDRMKGGKELR
jgi:hypothetical protein